MSRARDKKSGSPKGLLILLGIYILIQFISGVGFGSFLLFLIPIALLAVAGLFLGRALKQGKIKTDLRIPSKKQQDPADRYCKTCSDDFVYNNSHTEYDEHTAENNFAREKARRMKQLEEFYKNGLIDRKEYMLLRSRYERDQ